MNRIWKSLAELRALKGGQHVPAIMVSTGFIMLGHGIMTPVLPQFCDMLGCSGLELGAAISAFGLARLVLNVPVSIGADRFGRKPLLVAGPLINSVGMLGCGTASCIEELVAWRLVAGAGNSAYLGAAQLWLSDIATPETRARIIGANHSALLCGVSAGPALGGFVADAAGSLHAPFFVVGVGAAAAGMQASRLPETRRVIRNNPNDEENNGARGAEGESGQKKTLGGGEEAMQRGASSSPSPWSREPREPPSTLALAHALVSDPSFGSASIANFTSFTLRQGGRNVLLSLFAMHTFEYGPGDLGLLYAAMAGIDLLMLAPSAHLAVSP